MIEQERRMVTVSSVDQAMKARWSPHSNTNFRTQFMGEDRHKGERPDPTAPSPIAYLVEQGPHTQLRAHFHEADQFQIFVSGDGRIGAHEAAPGKGHFAGPFSGYGPIVAGEAGLAYMTLRNAYDPGAQWLPENIERIRPKRSMRREVLFESAPPADGSSLQGLREVEVRQIVAQQEDGLAAWSFLLPPDASATGPGADAGGGQFWLVMAGQMVDPEQGLLDRLSMAFVRPNEGPYRVMAGPAGLNVLVMQFPLFKAP
jgi:hypothetical protein